MRKIGNKRGSFIDYKKPGIFMITMNKLASLPFFCNIIKNESEADLYKAVHPDYLPLGFIIYHQLKNFKEIKDDIRVLQYKIMPDHIHFIVKIEKEIPYHLSHYLYIFKRNVFVAALKKNLINRESAVFEEGYNDQFLRYDRSLNMLYDYIRKNPYWYWMRWHKPGYFRRIHDKIIAGVDCSLYGNLALMDNPFKIPVIVHTEERGNPAVLKDKIELWEYTIANGGVLIGAFINDDEKAIRDLAFANSGKVILISNKGYEEREKPTGFYLEQCGKGNLLIITPDLVKELGKDKSFRQECVFMNKLAQEISRIEI